MTEYRQYEHVPRKTLTFFSTIAYLITQNAHCLHQPVSGRENPMLEIILILVFPSGVCILRW